MFAVFKSGGKQHRVVEGEVVRLERLDAEPGASVEFDEVLLVAEVVAHDRSDKVGIIKFRRRKHYLRRGSHRQHYTDVRITAIKG